MILPSKVLCVLAAIVVTGCNPGNPITPVPTRPADPPVIPLKPAARRMPRPELGPDRGQFEMVFNDSGQMDLRGEQRSSQGSNLKPSVP